MKQPKGRTPDPVQGTPQIMNPPATATTPPEYNVTGVDYSDRLHFRYSGPPLIDIHAHVMYTRPSDPKDGPPSGAGPGATLTQAETMLEVAQEFGVGRV